MQIALLLMVSQFFFAPIPMDWQMDQQNVAIRGTVVDYSGHPVQGATVVAGSASFDARTVSDSKGEFFFLTLFPGTYYLDAYRNNDSGNVYSIYSPASVPQELFAGYEYGATIVL